MDALFSLLPGVCESGSHLVADAPARYPLWCRVSQVVGCPLNVIHSLAGPAPGLCAGGAEKALYEVHRRGGETSAHAGVRTALDRLRPPICSTASQPLLRAADAQRAAALGVGRLPGRSCCYARSGPCARGTSFRYGCQRRWRGSSVLRDARRSVI